LTKKPGEREAWDSVGQEARGREVAGQEVRREAAEKVNGAGSTAEKEKDMDEETPEAVSEPGDEVEVAQVKGEQEEREKEEETAAREELEALREELRQKEQLVEEYRDDLQRLGAEFANYRRRVQAEREDTRRYATAELISELLPIIDNLERAIDSARHQAREGNALLQGVELTLRQFLEVLDRQGLKAIEAKGQPFDPRFHEAVMQVETEVGADNMVVEEMQKGYCLGDRLIRPSLVKVSKRIK